MYARRLWMLCVGACVCLTPTAGWAQGSLADANASDMCSVPGLQAKTRQVQNGDIDARHLAIIYLILRNTTEGYIHRQRGATENKVYINDDGREAVYDAAGELVKDGINDGSYNYYHPEKFPLQHFTFDMCPWIKMGNSRRDTTTVGERINAYLNDVAGGVVNASKQKDELTELSGGSWSEKGQAEALAVYLLAAEKGGAEELFDLYDANNTLTEKQMVMALTKLAQGFLALYE